MYKCQLLYYTKVKFASVKYFITPSPKSCTDYCSRSHCSRMIQKIGFFDPLFSKKIYQRISLSSRMILHLEECQQMWSVWAWKARVYSDYTEVKFAKVKYFIAQTPESCTDYCTHSHWSSMIQKMDFLIPYFVKRLLLFY